MEVDNNLGLLAQLMNKLLKPGVQISEENVGKLVKYFTGMNDVVSQELFNHVLKLWFAEAIGIWETAGVPSSEILSLSLNIAVYLSADECSFINLNSQDLFHRFIKLLKRALKQLQARPNIGYIKLMSGFLKHKAGCEWLLSESYWSEIIDLSLHDDQDCDLNNECYNFIVKLLEESVAVETMICTKILYKIIKPILDMVELTKIQNQFDEIQFLKNCSTTLNLLNEVLELILVNKNVILYHHVIKNMEQLHFEDHCFQLLHTIKDRDAAYKILNILFMLSLHDFMYKCKGAKILTSEELWTISTKSLRIRKEISQSKMIIAPRILYNCIRCVDKIRDICPNISIKGKLISLAEQIVFYQIGVICYISIKFFGEDYALEGEKDKFRGNVMEKCYKRLLPLSFYFLLQLKLYLKENFTFQDGIVSLEYILKSRQFYDRNEAKSVLVYCIYNYEDISHVIARDDETVTNHPLILEYLAKVIETIATFLTDFDLNWQDIFENLTLIEITLVVIMSPMSTKKVIKKGLELIKIAVSKELSLNMALLSNEMDHEMDEIITICSSKIDGADWEIQNAAIQVVESIAHIVSKDFLTFKEKILEEMLPSRIAHIAVSHDNQVIRTSALQCLQEMAKVEDFWTKITNYCNIYDETCRMLADETDIMVRREAAKLISTLYEQGNLDNAILFSFYDTMTYSIIEENDIETKNNALEFWKYDIHRHLMDQGWIDGKFPDVTFSVDTKKIVIMSNAEIRKRIVKVLYQLSETGCLFVLKTALEDKNQVFVDNVKVLIEEMSNTFKEYEINSKALEDMAFFNNQKSFYFDFGYDYDIDLSKKIISRQTLHPKDFLEFVENFWYYNHNNHDSEPFDITAVFQEILSDPESGNNFHFFDDI